MEVWIIITIAGAFFQNIRSSLQRYLKGQMGTTGATFVRFGYGLPFAYLYLAGLMLANNLGFPNLGDEFWLWVTVSALAQIAAQILLIIAFTAQNFTVGNAYARTQTIQAAIIGFILFGEALSYGAILAIVVSIIGVFMISVAKSELTILTTLKSIGTKAAIAGLGSGVLFGLTAVTYRQSTLQVDSEAFMLRGVITLCAAITLQTVLMLLWMALKNRKEILRVAKAWKPGLAVGFVGATATFCWFSAFTIQNAALVTMVAQIEMLFTYASSVFFFKEKITLTEILGCIFISFGIVLLVLL